jgi:hypothetical protein
MIKVLQRSDADFAKIALAEVSKRLIGRGNDKAAQRLQNVIEALEAETIHIAAVS